MFVHIQAYIADYVAFSFTFEEGCFLPLTLSLFLLHHVLFWSFVYEAFWRSWLNLGGRISSILSPILFFFSPLKRPKSEHFCGQIGEQISGVKIGDAPPKSELLASLYKEVQFFRFSLENKIQKALHISCFVLQKIYTLPSHFTSQRKRKLYFIP